MSTEGQKLDLLLAIIGIVFVAVIAIGVMLYLTRTNDDSLQYPTFSFTPAGTATTAEMTTDGTDGADTQPIPTIPSTQPVPPWSQKIKTTDGVERWYTNPALKFSFRLPDGYNAPDIDTGVRGVYGVAVYNDSGSRMIVLANPIATGTTISEADIRANLPGVTITDIKESHIGTVVRGLTFRTDAAEWGGDGISFWAAYNGYVYQFAAARKDQDLMDFVMQHWFFAPPTPRPPTK